MGGATDILADGLVSFRASCKRKWEALQGLLLKPVRALAGRQAGALDDTGAGHGDDASAGHGELESEVSVRSAESDFRCGGQLRDRGETSPTARELDGVNRFGRRAGRNTVA
jgi:hypothetical protein